jgi:hypothetical protein
MSVEITGLLKRDRQTDSIGDPALQVPLQQFLVTT